MLQKMHLTIHIRAAREKVWDVMLQDATYRDWTTAFSPGSYYVGSWEPGADIRFLGPSHEGEGESGMISRIAEIRKPEFVSIEHRGFIQNGKEDLSSDAINVWRGSRENYTFVEKDGGTELVIDIDVPENEKTQMEGMWVTALARLKELAEAHA